MEQAFATSLSAFKTATDRHHVADDRPGKGDFQHSTVRLLTSRPGRHPDDAVPHAPIPCFVDTAPPDGEDPVQWYLLTTLKVSNAGAAAKNVGFYLQRWRVKNVSVS